MEENKVATDSELRKRAGLLVKCLVPKTCEVGCEECISLVFRELVAVRDATIKDVLRYEVDVAAYEAYCAERGEKP